MPSRRAGVGAFLDAAEVILALRFQLAGEPGVVVPIDLDAAHVGPRAQDELLATRPGAMTYGRRSADAATQLQPTHHTSLA